MTLNERAREILARALDQPVGQIDRDATIGVQRGWDSLGHVKVIMTIEATISRQLRVGELGQLRSIRDIESVLDGMG